MKITDNEDETTSVSHNVRVNSRPTARFTFSPDTPNVGQKVTLDAGASTDNLAIPNANYDWDLDGDGQYDDAQGKTTSVTFRTTGDKTVRLRVTDSDGVTATARGGDPREPPAHRRVRLHAGSPGHRGRGGGHVGLHRSRRPDHGPDLGSGRGRAVRRRGRHHRLRDLQARRDQDHSAARDRRAGQDGHESGDHLRRAPRGTGDPPDLPMAGDPRGRVRQRQAGAHRPSQHPQPRAAPP